MDSRGGAGAVLLSPLAIDDVFRQKTVPEIQELLRQLQLQQANDAEELRTLIGVRYLSFLEGLPEISRMQVAAEDALLEAREFGVGLCQLEEAVAKNEIGDGGNKHCDEPQLGQQVRQQLLQAQELPLQSSTPLDGFVAVREFLPSPAPCLLLYEQGRSHAGVLDARQRLPLRTTGDGERQKRQPETLRHLQQQLLLLPSRVWEAVRCQQFLVGLRLASVEGSRQVAMARTLVQQFRQEQAFRVQHEGSLVRHLSGCWALAQHTASAAPSLISAVRALALRYLAGARISPKVAADATAAVTMLQLLDNGRTTREASEGAEAEPITATAKWLLGVFFSARGEALEASGFLGPENVAATGAALAATADGHVAGSMRKAIDTAESLIEAFCDSLEASVFLFCPSETDGNVAGAVPLAGGFCAGGPTSSALAGGSFAAARGAQTAFGALTSSDPPEALWALQALPKVFSVFASHLCKSNSSDSSNGWEACSCTGNNELCPRAKTAAFVRQWGQPLKQRLCRLLAGASWLCLRDIRAFWLTLIERLEAHRPQRRVWSCASLFVIGYPALETNFQDASRCTAQLLEALGDACVSACISVVERRTGALPLLCFSKGEDEPYEIFASPEGKGKESQKALEEDFLLLLEEVAGLFGRPGESAANRAAPLLRATVAAAMLRSLAKCCLPLAAEAVATAATVALELKKGGPVCSKDGANASVMGKARKVEWLFVACRDGEAAAAAGETTSTWLQKGPEVADGQRQIAAFFAEWAAAGLQGQEVAQPTASCLQQLQRTSCSLNREGVEAQGEERTARAVARAAAAARTLSSCLCFCSLLGYAVGLWPVVKDAVTALRASWRWHQRAAAVPPLKFGYSSVNFSGGALSFLLELNRALTVVSGTSSLEDIRAAPLLRFALKALAAEEVAAIGAEAVTDAAEQRQRQLQEHQLDLSGSSAAQSYLLQLLIDLELVAVALDVEPPLSRPQEIPEVLESLETLPQPVRRTVEAALGGQRSAEALRNVTRKGRKALQPALVDTLEQRVKAGFSTSGSLLLALLPGSEAHGGASSCVSIPGGEDERALPQPPLLVPRERLSLLPVTPLPAFESLLLRHAHKKSVPAPPHAPPEDGETKGQQRQQQTKETPKQSHRLRLDDAVDSVSRGLQSWLKRGSTDGEGTGLFPSKSGAASGAVRGAASGGGLAEAWAKQVGQVSALIGQHVEAVHSRASQAASFAATKNVDTERAQH